MLGNRSRGNQRRLVTTRKDEAHAPGLAILHAKLLATKPKKRTFPRTPAERRGRMTSPPMTIRKSTRLHHGPLIQDTPRSMPVQFTSVAVGECSRQVREWRSIEEEWAVSLRVNVLLQVSGQIKHRTSPGQGTIQVRKVATLVCQQDTLLNIYVAVLRRSTIIVNN